VYVCIEWLQSKRGSTDIYENKPYAIALPDTEDAIDGVTESMTERVDAVNASFEQLNLAAQSSSRCQSGEHGRVA